MQINYTEDAFSSLVQLINYIESTNTQGAGLRWLYRYESFLEKKLNTPKQIRCATMQRSINCNFAASTSTIE